MPTRPLLVLDCCCLRCGHRWQAAPGAKRPRRCASHACGTTAWDGPGKRGRPATGKGPGKRRRKALAKEVGGEGNTGHLVQ